ncbi:plasma membrane snare protein-like protein [Hortaea werneckii]|nr:plasma membrane snare protein-like protein [Hortaea werneckii]
MGWGKKKGDAEGELESKRSRLFGGKKDKPASPAPSASNPYAAAPPSNGNPYASKSSNPYAGADSKSDPYAAPSQSSFSQPPSTSYSSATLTSEPGNPPAYSAGSSFSHRGANSPAPGSINGAPPRYSAAGGSSYGQAGGYGSNPYGSGGSSAQPSRGAGGYGGLGRSNSQETMGTDAGRSALLGDAAQRAQQNPSPAPQQAADPSYSNAGGYESTEMPGGYGGAPEMTEEEQEEQEVAAIKGEAKEIKREDVQRLRNARRIAEQAEMTGRDTLARLGGQGDRIHNTERNLDMASNHNRLAEEKARELRTLNRSMWAVHVSNPFTKESRRRAGEEIALDKHQAERRQRDETTQAAISSSSRHQKQNRDLNGNIIRQANNRTLADRQKYQFEADSEDDEMENEIDESLEVLRHGAQNINKIGKAMSEEIDNQNGHLDRITDKTDRVDDQIALNRHRLQNIR